MREREREREVPLIVDIKNKHIEYIWYTECGLQQEL